MKKLIYFYSEALRGFEKGKAEFAFSSAYDITFDGTNQLTIQRNRQYINEFFGKNIEINAVVGNNGSSKSTLLKEIYEILTVYLYNFSIFIKTNPCILIFETQKHDGHYIETYHINDIKYKKSIDMANDNSKILISFDKLEWNSTRNNLQEDLKTIKHAYITQILDKELCDRAKYFDRSYGNYSPGAVLNPPSFNVYSYDKTSETEKFFYREFLDQAFFLSDKVFISDGQKKNKIKLPFAISEAVKVRIKDYDLAESFHGLRNEDETIPSEEIDDMIRAFRGCDEQDRYLLKHNHSGNGYERFVEGLLAFFLEKLERVPKENYKRSSESLFVFVKNCIGKIKDIPNIAERMKAFLEYFKDVPGGVECNGDPESFSEMIELFLQADWKSSGKAIDNYGGLSIPFFYRSNDGKEHYAIKEFYEKYEKIYQPPYGKQIFDFSWGLSSGENSMLNLYSKFYQICQSAEKESNVLLMIDEADESLHPQWQKDYVYSIISVLTSIFQDIGVQVIITTHSPIMLSDIPKQNVLYLKKEQDKSGVKVISGKQRHETFSANIFRLFQDTFFLDGAGVGTFAESWLLKLLEDIHKADYSNSEQVENIKNKIDNIGDPVLKRNFESEFFSYIGNSNSIDEQIRILRQKLAELEKQKKKNT